MRLLSEHKLGEKGIMVRGSVQGNFVREKNCSSLGVVLFGSS